MKTERQSMLSLLDLFSFSIAIPHSLPSSISLSLYLSLSHSLARSNNEKSVFENKKRKKRDREDDDGEAMLKNVNKKE